MQFTYATQISFFFAISGIFLPNSQIEDIPYIYSLWMINYSPFSNFSLINFMWIGYICKFLHAVLICWTERSVIY